MCQVPCCVFLVVTMQLKWNFNMNAACRCWTKAPGVNIVTLAGRILETRGLVFLDTKHKYLWAQSSHRHIFNHWIQQINKIDFHIAQIQIQNTAVWINIKQVFVKLEYIAVMDHLLFLLQNPKIKFIHYQQTFKILIKQWLLRINTSFTCALLRTDDAISTVLWI